MKICAFLWAIPVAAILLTGISPVKAGFAAVGGVGAGRNAGGINASGPVVDGTQAPVVGSSSPAASVPRAVASIRGIVRRQDKTPAKEVGVRFERRVEGLVDRVVTATTDRAGAYRVELGDGTWQGMVCDSSLGFLPTLWEISVKSGEVDRFREILRANVEIRRAEIALSSTRGIIQPGDLVNLVGIGFRCSGYVLVEVAGMEPVHQKDFIAQEDTGLSFSFPPLTPVSNVSGVIVNRAKFTFVQGPLRSNSLEFRAPMAMGAPSTPQAPRNSGPARFPTF